MKIISCNYSGNIPGVGRGPIENRPVSDAVYKQLTAMGFPITIKTSKATPSIKKVVRVMNVQTIEEKRAEKISATVEKAPIAKERVVPTQVEEIKEVTPVEEAVQTVVEEKVETVDQVEAEVQAEVEAKTEQKVYTSEELNAMSITELDALVPAEVTRPSRYGKPWLIKQYLAYVSAVG